MCLVISMAFLWQDLIWANPDINTRYDLAALQPPSAINSIDLRIEADVRYALTEAGHARIPLRISPPASPDGIQTIIELGPYNADGRDRIITGTLCGVEAGKGLRFTAIVRPDGTISIDRAGKDPVVSIPEPMVSPSVDGHNPASAKEPPAQYASVAPNKSFINRRVKKAIENTVNRPTEIAKQKIRGLLQAALTGLNPEEITVDGLKKRIEPIEGEIRKLEEEITIIGKRYTALRSDVNSYIHFNRPGISIGPICVGLTEDFVKVAGELEIPCTTDTKFGSVAIASGIRERILHDYAVVKGKDGPIAVDITYGQFPGNGGKTILIERLADYEKRIADILDAPQIEPISVYWNKAIFPFARLFAIAKAVLSISPDAPALKRLKSNAGSVWPSESKTKVSIVTQAPTPSLDADDLERFHDDWLKEKRVSTTPKDIPGACAFVRRLAETGTPIYIASGGSLEWMEPELEKLDIYGAFDGKVYDMAHTKDEILQMAKAASGGRRVVMFGDAKHDMDVARAAGAVAIGRAHSAVSDAERFSIGAERYICDYTSVAWDAAGHALSLTDINGQTVVIDNVGAFVFDYDGTLVDTTGLVSECYALLAARAFNVAPADLDPAIARLAVSAWREKDGRPKRECIDNLCAKLKAYPAAAMELQADDARQSAMAFDGVDKLKIYSLTGQQLDSLKLLENYPIDKLINDFIVLRPARDKKLYRLTVKALSLNASLANYAKLRNLYNNFTGPKHKKADLRYILRCIQNNGIAFMGGADGAENIIRRRTWAGRADFTIAMIENELAQYRRRDPSGTFVVGDFAVSDGVTSLELAKRFAGKNVKVIATDRMTWCWAYDTGDYTVFLDPSYGFIQAISHKPGAGITKPENMEEEDLIGLKMMFRKKLEPTGPDKDTLEKISLIDPDAEAFATEHPDMLEFRNHDVFEYFEAEYNFVRVLGLLMRGEDSYFKDDKIKSALKLLASSLTQEGALLNGYAYPGGLRYDFYRRRGDKIFRHHNKSRGYADSPEWREIDLRRGVPLTRDNVHSMGAAINTVMYPGANDDDPTLPTHIERGVRTLTRYSNILSDEGKKVLAQLRECSANFDPVKAKKLFRRIPIVGNIHPELFVDVKMPDGIFLNQGHAMVQLNKGCYHQCAGCQYDAGKAYEYMPYPMVIKLKGELKKLGIKDVVFYEDSDALHYRDDAIGADFSDVYSEYAQDMEVISIITNGWYMDDKVAQRSAEKLAEMVAAKVSSEFGKGNKIDISYLFYYDNKRYPLISALKAGDTKKADQICEDLKAQYKNVIRTLYRKVGRHATIGIIDSPTNAEVSICLEFPDVLRECERRASVALKEITAELRKEEGINIAGLIKPRLYEWCFGKARETLKSLVPGGDLSWLPRPRETIMSVTDSDNDISEGVGNLYHIFRPDGSLELSTELPFKIGERIDDPVKEEFLWLLFYIHNLLLTGKNAPADKTGEHIDIKTGARFEEFIRNGFTARYPGLCDKIKNLDFGEPVDDFGKPIKKESLQDIYMAIKDIDLPYVGLDVFGQHKLTVIESKEEPDSVEVSISFVPGHEQDYVPASLNPLNDESVFPARVFAVLPDFTARWYGEPFVTLTAADNLLVEVSDSVFFRDFGDAKEATRSVLESVISMLLRKKKLVLAFHSGLKGNESGRMRTLLSKLESLKNKVDFKKVLEGLVIIPSFTSEEELNGQLAKEGVDPNDTEHSSVFMFCEKGGIDKSRIGHSIKAVFIQEKKLEGKEFNGSLHYYPLFEMVAITLIKENQRFTVDQVRDAVKNLGISFDRINIDIDALTDRFGPSAAEEAFLVFTLVPKAERIDPNEKRERYQLICDYIASAA